MKSNKRKNLLCKIALLIFCCSVLFTCGCAARAQKMIPASFDLTGKHPDTVAVKTSIHYPDSGIPNSAFSQALSESVLKSGIFKGIVNGEGADYLLNVAILDYNRPWIGLDFDINVKAKWELSKSDSQNPIWSEIITTSYKSKLCNAFFAAERLRKANESAVLANIQEGIKRLSLLKL